MGWLDDKKSNYYIGNTINKGNSLHDVRSKKIKGCTNKWCGDLWKTIVYFRKYHSNLLKVKVLDTDFGLGIIEYNDVRLKTLNVKEEGFLKINKLTYQDLTINKAEWLGLEHVGQDNEMI